MERHKERREGKITGVGKEINNPETESNLEQQYDINPIINNTRKADIKRKKTYNNPIVSKSLDIEEIKEKASGSKKELFDIEEAFARLQEQHKAPDHDTQLEIMSELFSDNPVEYNDTVEFEKNSETNRIMISEEELMKLLDEREKVHQKKLEKRRKREKKEEERQQKLDTTAPYVKEDLEIAEVNEIVKDDSIKNRLGINEDRFEELESKLTRKSWPLVVILVVLALILGFLIYQFFA
ncbi:hypothetical protein LJB88_04105 [Erysipelotrichaceae bacterium OttesenSCG-928-M19]|nr:hypothetical protein [Erysipelotrichaceae bacterium OttesenSCG-928-M19]